MHREKKNVFLKKTSLISCVTGTWLSPSEIPYFHNPKLLLSQIHDSRVRGLNRVFTCVSV